MNSTKAFKTDLRDIDWSKGDYVEYKNAANILFREYGRYIRLTPAWCDRSSVGVIDMQIRNTLNRENIMGFSHSGRMYNGANALFNSSIVDTLSCLISFSKNGITQKKRDYVIEILLILTSRNVISSNISCLNSRFRNFPILETLIPQVN